jgi:hypothetical protein
MRKGRTQLVLLGAIVAGLLVGAWAPPRADATVSYYNCVLKPSYDWCDGRANGSFDGLNSWDYNQASYDGPWDYTVNVCQMVWKPSTGQVLLGHACGWNINIGIYGHVTCACYEAQITHTNSSPRSISGFADADRY